MPQPSADTSATRDRLHAQVTTWIGHALRCFELRDEPAFRQLDVSEWTCAFRLAVYLDRLVEDAATAGGDRWNVDAEYNRQGVNRASKRGSDGPIRPDIVIHRRGQGEVEHNLLFLEIKKFWYGAGNKDDLRKVEAAVSGKDSSGQPLDYQYRFGAVLGLWTLSVPGVPRFDPHWIFFEEDGPGRSKRSPLCRVPMPRT